MNKLHTLWVQRIALIIFLVAATAILIHPTAAAPQEDEASTEPEPQETTASEPQETTEPTTDIEEVDPSPEPTCIEEDEPSPEPTPQVVERYAAITMTEAEREELAAIIYLEARSESAEGQQAVAEVVLNRVISSSFPDSVSEVLHQGENGSVPQFSTIYLLSEAEPGQAQYDAIDAALYGPSILPADVVFFSRSGENDRVWGVIGNHVFCYAYTWD